MNKMNSELQKILNSEIPLTKEIGISVGECADNSLTLNAPLENNINHKRTAFGGSIYSVSVLSGWGLIYLFLRRHGLSGHIVIQDSITKFLKPVTSTISSKCSFRSKEQQDNFIKIYKRKGKARIQLESRIEGEGSTNVIFIGTYVVHK